MIDPWNSFFVRVPVHVPSRIIRDIPEDIASSPIQRLKLFAVANVLKVTGWLMHRQRNQVRNCGTAIATVAVTLNAHDRQQRHADPSRLWVACKPCLPAIERLAGPDSHLKLMGLLRGNEPAALRPARRLSVRPRDLARPSYLTRSLSMARSTRRQAHRLRFDWNQC